MSAVAVSPAGIVTSCGLPVVVTATVLVEPSAVSVTVHTVPEGRSSNVAGSGDVAPAGMVTSVTRTSAPQSTWMVTGPCSPADGPAMVLVTVSEPGTNVYVSVTPTVPVPSAATVTGDPVIVVVTSTVLELPS